MIKIARGREGQPLIYQPRDGSEPTVQVRVSLDQYVPESIEVTCWVTEQHLLDLARDVIDLFGVGLDAPAAEAAS